MFKKRVISNSYYYSYHVETTGDGLIPPESLGPVQKPIFP